SGRGRSERVRPGSGGHCGKLELPIRGANAVIGSYGMGGWKSLSAHSARKQKSKTLLCTRCRGLTASASGKSGSSLCSLYRGGSCHRIIRFRQGVSVELSAEDPQEARLVY